MRVNVWAVCVQTETLIGGCLGEQLTGGWDQPKLGLHFSSHPQLPDNIWPSSSDPSPLTIWFGRFQKLGSSMAWLWESTGHFLPRRHAHSNRDSSSWHPPILRGQVGLGSFTRIVLRMRLQLVVESCYLHQSETTARPPLELWLTVLQNYSLKTRLLQKWKSSKSVIKTLCKNSMWEVMVGCGGSRWSPASSLLLHLSCLDGVCNNSGQFANRWLVNKVTICSIIAKWSPISCMCC